MNKNLPLNHHKYGTNTRRVLKSAGDTPKYLFFLSGTVHCTLSSWFLKYRFLNLNCNVKSSFQNLRIFKSVYSVIISELFLIDSAYKLYRILQLSYFSPPAHQSYTELPMQTIPNDAPSQWNAPVWNFIGTSHFKQQMLSWSGMAWSMLHSGLHTS